jgi:hypothetical protein
MERYLWRKRFLRDRGCKDVRCMIWFLDESGTRVLSEEIDGIEEIITGD